MTEYKPGSFFLSHIGGTTGFWIGVGQALCGAPSRFSHAGIVLDRDGLILEAEPGGARLGTLSQYEGRPLLVSDAPILTRSVYQDEQMARDAVVAQAHRLVGVGYSFLDYAALAALHLHLPSRWIRQRVESSGHLICSALVDRAFMNAGIHIFSDGRLPGDVMPSDLAGYAEDWASTNG